MKDYSKLQEIVVKSQAELDEIQTDYQGRIYIEFGTWYNKAVVSKKYSRPIEARGNSSVVARENSSVVAWENSSVVAWENSSVEAWGNSSVVANGNVRVEARGNSSVVARGNSSVEARGNSSVVAWENSSVVAWENSKATFYKAVHKTEDGYQSDYDWHFIYEIGKFAKESNLNTNTLCDCASGIHISTLDFALSFGENWKDLAILEVEAKIDDIIVPKNSEGKVRTNKVKVLREIPLEECGVYGKILARRRGENV